MNEIIALAARSSCVLRSPMKKKQSAGTVRHAAASTASWLLGCMVLLQGCRGAVGDWEG
jgi:hypothetical protein